MKINLFGEEENKAKYKSSDCKKLIGNPFYEALPRFETLEKNLINGTNSMIITEEDRSMPDRYRLDILHDVYDVIFLIETHLRLQVKVHELITGGYKTRNPLSREYLIELNRLGESSRIKDNGNNNTQGMEYAKGTSKMMVVFGITAVGKSTALELIVGQYP